MRTRGNRPEGRATGAHHESPDRESIPGPPSYQDGALPLSYRGNDEDSTSTFRQNKNRPGRSRRGLPGTRTGPDQDLSRRPRRRRAERAARAPAPAPVEREVPQARPARPSRSSRSSPRPGTGPRTGPRRGRSPLPSRAGSGEPSGERSGEDPGAPVTATPSRTTSTRSVPVAAPHSSTARTVTTTRERADQRIFMAPGVPERRETGMRTCGPPHRREVRPRGGRRAAAGPGPAGAGGRCRRTRGADG